MIDKFKDLMKKGLFHIFSSNLINKVIQFGISIVLVRLISKTDYGRLSYAQNILNIFMLIQGLGVVDGLLQFCSESDKDEERVSYLKYAAKFGLTVNFILTVLIISVSLMVNFKIEGSNSILIKLSFIPLISFMYNLILMFLRAILDNKRFSRLNICNSTFYLLGNIILGKMYGINGIIASNYIAYGISVIIGLTFIKEYLKNPSEIKEIGKDKKREFIKFSITASINNSISQILYLLDTFLIGVFIADATVIATYKNATLIPFNLTFIPISLAIFAYPYFAKKSEDKVWIRKTYTKMVLGLGVLNLIITIGLIVFAPLIIKILFGKQYLDGIQLFRLLAVGYFISGTFRVPAGNTLFAMKKLKVNLVNSIVSGVANIILDIVLIKKYGSLGATVATISVFIISALIANIYIYKYTKVEKTNY